MRSLIERDHGAARGGLRRPPLRPGRRPRRADRRARAAPDRHRDPRRLPAAGRAAGAPAQREDHRVVGHGLRRHRHRSGAQARHRGHQLARPLRPIASPTPRGRCCWPPCAARPAFDRMVRAGKWMPDPPIFTDKVWGERIGHPRARRDRQGDRASRRRLRAWTSRTTAASGSADVAYRYYDDPVELARDVRILVVAMPGGSEHARLRRARE